MGSWDNVINKIAEYNTPSEWRETGKLLVAAALACGTWGVLGWLIYAQFTNNVAFGDKISAISPTEKDRIAFFVNFYGRWHQFTFWLSRVTRPCSSNSRNALA